MRFLIWCSMILASAPAAYAAGPFADVPKAHWAYGVMEAVEKSGGFTGYPRGKFSGPRALTRYEFAVAIQRIGTELSRVDEPPPVSPEQQLRVAALDRVGLLRTTAPPDFGRLADEFGAELKLLGSAAEKVKSSARPDAPKAQPPAIPPTPKNPSADYRQGAQEAREQWKQGRVVLYAAGLPQASFDAKLGVPYRHIAGCLISNQARELMAGHNAEVYRLVLEHGLPTNHRREWLRELKEPAAAWLGDRPARTTVAFGGAFVPAPGGEARARIRLEGGELPVVLEVEREGKVVTRLGLGNARQDGPPAQVAWAAGGELLFVRDASNANNGNGLGYLALDVRTGDLVTRAFVSGPSK